MVLSTSIISFLLLYLHFTDCNSVRSRNARSSTCGIAKKEHSFLRILGGHKVNSDDYPWFLSILVKFGDGELRNSCGGALITQFHGLSGAHCFYNPRSLDAALPTKLSEKYEVHINVKKMCSPGPDGTKVDLYNVDIHDGWLQRTKLPKDDIALLTFKAPISNTPLCLPSKKVYDWETGVIIGFGSTMVRRTYPCTMLRAEISIFPEDKCKKSIYGRFMAVRTICGGTEEGGIDACDGDSGGPLMVEVNGRYEIVGLVSYGKGCGRKGYYAVFTDVSDKGHGKWIKERVNLNEPGMTDPPPPPLSPPLSPVLPPLAIVPPPIVISPGQQNYFPSNPTIAKTTAIAVSKSSDGGVKLISGAFT